MPVQVADIFPIDEDSALSLYNTELHHLKDKKYFQRMHENHTRFLFIGGYLKKINIIFPIS